MLGPALSVKDRLHEVESKEIRFKGERGKAEIAMLAATEWFATILKIRAISWLQSQPIPNIFDFLGSAVTISLI